MNKTIVFIDSEIDSDGRIADIGAVYEGGAELHDTSAEEFENFITGADFICGHNVIHHDMKYISPVLKNTVSAGYIDTLYLSPLLFPERPYHALIKDDKLLSDELNNPLNDAIKAQRLFHDEVNAFMALDERKKKIYFTLLGSVEEFKGFFEYLGFTADDEDTGALIHETYLDNICENADLEMFVRQCPVELAYTLALIGTEDHHSVTPPWLIHNFPNIENIIKLMCNTRCKNGCPYCRAMLDIRKKLKEFFGFDEFRTFDNEPLQESAAQAAADGKSLLAVFPTSGGKSVTFQLPALMAGQTERGLTVVISPLQSLMKDQVDNLSEKGLTDAATVNGLLSPIERTEALERVSSGLAAIIYISPEQLRSRTIERLLLSRNVVRFVIDEAHCFSAWGQDFRVDYLYIGDFIREYCNKKGMNSPIPVSCFTATAKQKVISDIRDYFKEKLGLELELFASSAARKNLRYSVIYRNNDTEKYGMLRQLIEQRECPTIIYVSRTRRTSELADKLTKDGFPALPYNGKMEASEKTANQDAFMSGEVRIIVATSAFGMGVDKKDVGLVIHYDISDSLENYVQEAGRAGRDPMLNAECYVLFNNDDLDKHFTLLNQTKLSIGDIQRVWSAMKGMTKYRPTVCCSALEIARAAGWDDSKKDVETRVKTAISALEQTGYIKRGHNVPHVYATGILVKNAEEARKKIERSGLFTEKETAQSIRIITCLISERSRTGNSNEAESRVDYLADKLYMDKKDVIGCVTLMRRAGVLADSMDMSAYIYSGDNENRSLRILENNIKLERFLLEQLGDEEKEYNLKQLNEAAENAGIKFSNIRRITTLLYFLTIKEYITKERRGNDNVVITPGQPLSELTERFDKRCEIARFIVKTLYSESNNSVRTATSKNGALVEFSVVGLYNDFIAEPRFDISLNEIGLSDVQDALLYLSKIESMKLEGGFFVLYNGMELKRLILDNKIRYKYDDYRSLESYYKHKIQQIHIVGEYANLMVKDYNSALQFVQDYFRMDFKGFIAKYFKGERAIEITRNISPEKYHQLVDELSDVQRQIISDARSKYIVVAAGPGSGKTRVLVHKLASLMMLEDAKHEQLLMLTFSRAAATEFKKRLMVLIGNAANFIEIKTFHSYCFDLLGKIGSLDGIEDVIPKAVEMINSGEVEIGRIAKSVMVIDEAQDMDCHEYALVRALMSRNEDLRVIAVGDDDQNIYQFRGSNSRYMKSFISEFGAAQYELIDNYRSRKNIVSLANEFAKTLKNRMKTTPIHAKNGENGTVRIIRHKSENLVEPVVNNVIETYLDGRACVLTSTNDEALQVCSMLNKRGIRARLIQSLGDFKLRDLAEVRYFLKKIDERLQTAVVSSELWEYAKSELNEKYRDSDCIEICNNMISDYEKTKGYSIYRTDLEEFIGESQYDDFYPDGLDAVYVSTIHKAKGREFDNVYMLLNKVRPDGGEQSRKLYVGITRAKNNLYIHCNGNVFDDCNIPDIKTTVDEKDYSEPCEIALALAHTDFYLDHFKRNKNFIFGLRSGMHLSVNDNALTADLNGRVVRAAVFSRKLLSDIKTYEKKGYVPYDAVIKFIVAWKCKDDGKFYPVPLVDLFFRR